MAGSMMTNRARFVLSCYRKHDHELCALRTVARHPVLDPDAAAIAVHERLDQIEAEAHALRLAGAFQHQVEDFALEVIRDAWGET
jgi:hypothetical protein